MYVDTLYLLSELCRWKDSDRWKGYVGNTNEVRNCQLFGARDGGKVLLSDGGHSPPKRQKLGTMESRKLPAVPTSLHHPGRRCRS